MKLWKNRNNDICTAGAPRGNHLKFSIVNGKSEFTTEAYGVCDEGHFVFVIMPVLYLRFGLNTSEQH